MNIEVFNNLINERKSAIFHILVYFLFFFIAAYSFSIMKSNNSNKVDSQDRYSSKRMLVQSYKKGNISTFSYFNTSLNEINNTFNHKNKRFTQFRMKNLENLTTENKDQPLPIKGIERSGYFFDIIKSNFYKGKWRSSKKPFNFEFLEGLFELKFVQGLASSKFPSNTFKFTIRDGYYFENYISFDIIFDIKINPLVNNNIIFNLNSVLLEAKTSNYFSDIGNYRKLVYLYSVCFINTNIKFSDLLTNQTIFNKIEGNINISKCSFDIIDFDLKPSLEDPMSKSESFSKCLLFVGIISLLSSINQFQRLNNSGTIAAKVIIN